DEVAPVLLVLAAPDELRIEVAVSALVGHAHRVLLVLSQDGLVFRSRDILALSLRVLEGLHGLAGDWFLGHGYFCSSTVWAVTDSIILLNSLATLALKSA